MVLLHMLHRLPRVRVTHLQRVQRTLHTSPRPPFARAHAHVHTHMHARTHARYSLLAAHTAQQLTHVSQHRQSAPAPTLRCAEQSARRRRPRTTLPVHLSSESTEYFPTFFVTFTRWWPSTSCTSSDAYSHETRGLRVAGPGWRRHASRRTREECLGHWKPTMRRRKGQTARSIRETPAALHRHRGCP
jgi:hypothetical protein